MPLTPKRRVLEPVIRMPILVYFFSEQELLREEISSLQAVKSRLKLRVAELEDELKKAKEELERQRNSTENENEVRYSE